RTAQARRNPRAQVAARARADAPAQGSPGPAGPDESRQGALALARQHAAVVADDALALHAPVEAPLRSSPCDLGTAQRGLGCACDVDLLEVLLDAHAHPGARPGAAHFGRNDPEIKRAFFTLPGMRTGDAQGLARVGPPPGHAEGVGHDTRARLKV